MEDLVRGIWVENPVLVQMLGLCPTLAVTNSVANSLAMGVATLAVLVASSFLVASLKRFIPNEVRIASYVLIIATFVTLADMTLEATVPNVHKALGAFIALIVVNCIILGRAEAFAAKTNARRAVLDAIGMGSRLCHRPPRDGDRERLLGSGSFLGLRVFGDGFEPWVIMVLPPGGFLTLGIFLLAISWQKERRARLNAAGRA
ncbi:MAG: electron transport complex subunit RsxE [Gemmatimonadetes bacterium]|nr:electron transport complex subunit RsxE [Gemmatimonadota bacterium]